MSGAADLARRWQMFGRTLRSHRPEDQGDTDTAASSLEEHLSAAIDCLLVDLLDPAAARLENAARITPEEILSS